MTLAIGWLHDGGETVGTWLHQVGDWHLGQRHLRELVGEYLAHYHLERNHQTTTSLLE